MEACETKLESPPAHSPEKTGSAWSNLRVAAIFSACMWWIDV